MMTDRYLELANTNLTKSLFDGLGLPTPVRLKREDNAHSHQLAGNVLLGSSQGADFSGELTSILSSTPVVMVNAGVEDKVNLVFDASGISSADESIQLYEFFNQNLKSLVQCGRVIMQKL